MVDMMFSAASRLMRIVGGMACAPRKSARLPLSVSLVDSSILSSAPRRTLTIPGWLKDISETGIGLVVPTIRQGDCYFTGVDRTLQIVFELASGPVQLQASPVRYEKLERDGGASVGYLIGAQITKMSDGDRVRFNEYLKTLR
jgi:hypothetical protein